MIRSRTFVAAALALLVSGSSVYAQRGGGHAGGALHGGMSHRGIPHAGARRGGVPHGGMPLRSVPRRGVPRGSVFGVPRLYSGHDHARFYGRYGWYGYGAPLRFSHPYYTFHPHLSLGFGLWLGYPVPYTSWYGYYNPYYYYPYYAPYTYAYPPDVQSTPQGSISPSQASIGGVSFDVNPSDAQVYVDGQYVGTVGQFTPTSQPLGLPAGRHHIQITAPGYGTMEFDADVVAGEVLPYQGDLER